MTKQRVTPRYVSVLLAVLAGILNVALTGIAFWLSYEHLHDVAAANGLPDHARAWAWPATLDTFIVIGEVLMLRASLAGKWDWWAASFMAIGSAGSITLNVVGVGDGAGTLAYIVAAVPPVAALLSFGMLMRQLHAAIKDYLAAPATQPAVAPKRPAATPPVPVAAPKSPPPARKATPRSATPQKTAQGVSMNHPKRPPETPAHATVPAGDLLTTAEAATLAGVSPATVRTWKHRGHLTPAVLDPDVLYTRQAVQNRMKEVNKP